MIQLDSRALDEVAPFAVVVTAEGKLVHVGRSVAKMLLLDLDHEVPNFFDLFEITKPRSLHGSRDLHGACGKRIAFRATRRGRKQDIMLRASIASLASDPDRFLILLSFAAGLDNLVEELGLSEQDFAYADPSIDLLYLLSTQTALLLDQQALTNRLREAKERAEAQALTDPLTGLPNRRGLEDFAEQLWSKGASAHLLHIDLDRFKQVNDTLGHAAGDAILNRVSEDLRAILEDNDFAARIGGDEFVMILVGREATKTVLELARDLVATISTPLEIGPHQAMVGASIGITTIHPDRQKSIDTCLLEADLALYDVKNEGRGAVRLFSGELRDREELTQELIRDIEPAIARGEFVPYYQVQLDTRTGSVFGVEVLGRWNHPKHGLILPSRFLYVSERAKLTERIDTALYLKALDDFAAWKAEGIAPPHISLNLTGRFLLKSGFIAWLTSELVKRGISTHEVVLELVETILVDGTSDAVRQHVEHLARLGFGLAIDDFGTGRASVTSLISIPVTLVKIDRAFVSKIDKDERRAMLTAAIIEISNQLGLETLAEGTETKEECRVVQELGCHVFQGFLFGDPIPGDQFAEKLRDQNWMATDALFYGPDAANRGPRLVT